MQAKLARWVGFGIATSLMPLLFNYLALLLSNKAPTVAFIVRDGQLLLIVSAMCSVALGEMIGSGPKLQVAKIFSGAATGANLFLSSGLFAYIAVVRADNGLLSDYYVSSVSYTLFAFAIFSCTTCIALSETR
jgi:hypothetical protein